MGIGTRIGTTEAKKGRKEEEKNKEMSRKKSYHA